MYGEGVLGLVNFRDIFGGEPYFSQQGGCPRVLKFWKRYQAVKTQSVGIVEHGLNWKWNEGHYMAVSP